MLQRNHTKKLFFCPKCAVPTQPQHVQMHATIVFVGMHSCGSGLMGDRCCPDWPDWLHAFCKLEGWWLLCIALVTSDCFKCAFRIGFKTIFGIKTEVKHASSLLHLLPKHSSIVSLTLEPFFCFPSNIKFMQHGNLCVWWNGQWDFHTTIPPHTQHFLPSALEEELKLTESNCCLMEEVGLWTQDKKEHCITMMQWCSSSTIVGSKPKTKWKRHCRSFWKKRMRRKHACSWRHFSHAHRQADWTGNGISWWRHPNHWLSTKPRIHTKLNMALNGWLSFVSKCFRNL